MLEAMPRSSSLRPQRPVDVPPDLLLPIDAVQDAVHAGASRQRVDSILQPPAEYFVLVAISNASRHTRTGLRHLSFRLMVARATAVSRLAAVVNVRRDSIDEAGFQHQVDVMAVQAPPDMVDQFHFIGSDKLLPQQR